MIDQRQETARMTVRNHQLLLGTISYINIPFIFFNLLFVFINQCIIFLIFNTNVSAILYQYFLQDNKDRMQVESYLYRVQI